MARKRQAVETRADFTSGHVSTSKMEHGKSRDKAEKAVGLNGKTAERAARAVEIADDLEAAGNEEGAHRIVEVLNTRGNHRIREAGRNERRTRPATVLLVDT
ncbi:MAG: hypothetical protein JNL58_28240 [Planctomyces sp.]|nr:hypothetical protein [Planctomyces sp.]